MDDSELREAQLRLYRVQAQWEPWKALAALIAAAAVFAGGVLGLSTWVSQRPQTIVVHMDQPLTLAPR
jgi:hypothetical protein